MRVGGFYSFFISAAVILPHTTLAQQSQAPSLWRIAIAGGWGWESNIAMRNAPYLPDAATVATADASFAKQGRLSRIGIDAIGGLVRYQTLGSFDRYSYEVQAVADRRFSNRWTGFLRGSARMSIASEATLDNESVLLPLAVSRMQTGAAGTAYRTSPMTTASLEGRYTHASFDSPGLIPASSTGARLGLVHRYNPRSDYGLTYLFDEYTETEPRTYVQTMTADWTPRTTRLEARFSAGASNIGRSLGTLSQITGIGSAYIQTPLARGATYLRFARFVGQSFGLGSVLFTNQAGVGYYRSLFRGNDTRLSADRAWSRDPQLPAQRMVTTNVSARLSKQFSTGLTLGSEVFLQHRDQAARISDHGVRLTAGYAVGSRGTR
jgi:hypothetical protein